MSRSIREVSYLNNITIFRWDLVPRVWAVYWHIQMYEARVIWTQWILTGPTGLWLPQNHELDLAPVFLSICLSTYFPVCHLHFKGQRSLDFMRISGEKNYSKISWITYIKDRLLKYYMVFILMSNHDVTTADTIIKTIIKKLFP